MFQENSDVCKVARVIAWLLSLSREHKFWSIGWNSNGGERHWVGKLVG